MKSDEWKQVSVGEVYSIGSGLSKNRSYFGSGYPFLSFRTIFNNYFLPDEIEDLVESSDVEREKCSIQKGDIFLTRTSETADELGMSSVALKDYPLATFNGFTKRLRQKRFDLQIDPVYIGYYLRSSFFRAQLTAMSSLTTRASLNNGMIERLVLQLPGINTQKKIGGVLRCIDEKIETNKRINDNLFQQAMTLFTERFIENPPNAEEQPLYCFADYINGTSFKPSEYSEEGLPIVKITELKNGLTNSTQYFNGSKDEKYIIQNKDILFSWSGNPDTSIDIFIWCGGKAILNQHTFNVKSKDNTPWFIYLLLKYYKPNFAQIASNKQTTGLGHVTVSDLKRLTFPYNLDMMKSFEESVSPLMEKLFYNTLENRKLETLRDTLLPRLMSGEIDVSNVAI